MELTKKDLIDISLDNEVLSELLNKDFCSLPEDYDFSYNQISNVSKYLGLNIEQLVSGEFNKDLVHRRFISPSLALPPEYLKAAGTFVETIKGVADYVEQISNSETKNYLLNKLEINKHILGTKNLLVNAKALLKTGKELSSLNLSKKDIDWMAMYVNRSASRSLISEKTRQCKSDFEIAKKIVEITNTHYDKNFKYSVEHFGDRFQIIGISNEEIHDELGLVEICDDIFTHFKAYTIANTPIENFGRKMNLLNVENNITNNRQIQKFTFLETMPHAH